MGKSLIGKRILFLAPSFFNYENVIKEKMIELGAEVVYYNERSISSALNRAILKQCPRLFDRQSDRYYENILSEHKNESFDYIFVIKCDMITARMLKKIKSTYPGAKMCLYLWDSVKLIPGILDKIKYFDSVYSFDHKDVSDIPELQLRPLFFSDVYMPKQKACVYKYDLAFCGTIHTDRYRILKNLLQQAECLHLNFYKFFYLQADFIYYWFKLTKPEFWGAPKSLFSFKKASGGEISSAMELTKVIVDIQSPLQTGLTMRTLEIVGLKKKLITTNIDIVNYDFYNPNNIMVISRDNPKLDKRFFESDYVDIPSEIYQKYSITSWILDILK